VNPRRSLLLALLSLLACVLVLPFAVPDDPGRRAADGSHRGLALEVLHAWDAARASAWRRGDPAALAALYTADAEAGRADRRLLGAYADRGLRVTGMRMQVADVEVERTEADRIVVVVTDRLVGAVAVGRGRRVALPRDGWSVRRVVLVREGNVWRVAAVEDQATPASTASTSGSANS
jgi:hypothetical protein